jgi:hypothetical protein
MTKLDTTSDLRKLLRILGRRAWFGIEICTGDSSRSSTGPTGYGLVVSTSRKGE